MDFFTDYRMHIGTNPEKFFKSTLFQSPRMLIGMDCLEPGQVQRLHSHAGRDKCYFVIEGEGEFTVGDQIQTGGPGTAVWAPADIEHGVTNGGTQRLVMLIMMAPEPE